ncbi:vWA domain-containing protein [Pseudomonas rhizoryzae]|uniref:vWA domain-containing protein n=1 Tax=Pseudomonas rhizoryzae TaxID=2571129 RepID=UPI0007378508|nr:VWA domain-containing protein [Pseudomonas rhizoryzae]KTS92527.1 von Willebrand factor A [Pseudomonas psychrotolerans]KTT22760.1 von Willebrand factor A [Pseudomonas psychrotolerans]KTT37989.1 von Willebrand factor A [Pseudomonas psychrotolerans]KTT73993.1 von Willebrand factor A [Pseudomonas psychrotolerans]
MFLDFFTRLRGAGIPVSIGELLDLHAALDAGLAVAEPESFYLLARALLVKDERFFDRFDLVYAGEMARVERPAAATAVPDEWLRLELQRLLSEEERQRLQALGGLNELLDALQQRLAEQRERHAAGNKWVGTGGTSPFGSGGYNPFGVRIGEAGTRQGRAAKVWEQRDYRNLDDRAPLDRRNLQLALRRLRRFARQGAAAEFDLEGTVGATAREGGLLDVRYRPERHNATKVLLLLDIGGSMDLHVRLCSELFSACRLEFRHLEYYYFHNCVYERVWRDNARRHDDSLATEELLRRYNADYRLVIVGDASMGPYEITHPGGSVEHWNEEPGAVWIQRLCQHFPRAVWLNPYPQEGWASSTSIQLLRELMVQRMFPLTGEGLGEAIRSLTRS